MRYESGYKWFWVGIVSMVVLTSFGKASCHDNKDSRPADLWRYYQHGIADLCAVPVDMISMFGAGQNPANWLNPANLINTPYVESDEAAFEISGYKSSFPFGNPMDIDMNAARGNTIRIYAWAMQNSGAAVITFTVKNAGGSTLLSDSITWLSTNCEAAATRPWYCDYKELTIPGDAAGIYVTLHNNPTGASGRNGTSGFSRFSWELVTSVNTYTDNQKQDPWTGAKYLPDGSLDTPLYRLFGQEHLRWGGTNYTQYPWNFWRGPEIDCPGVTHDMTTKQGIEDWYLTVTPYNTEERNHGVMYLASRYQYGLLYGTLPPMEPGWASHIADVILADQHPVTGYWGNAIYPSGSMAITFHFLEGLFNYYSHPRSDRADSTNPMRYWGPGYENVPRPVDLINTTHSLQSTYVNDEGQSVYAAWPRKTYHWTTNPNSSTSDGLRDKCWLPATANAIQILSQGSRWLSEPLKTENYNRIKSGVHYALKYNVLPDGTWQDSDASGGTSAMWAAEWIIEYSDYLERRIVPEIAAPDAGLSYEQGHWSVKWNEPYGEQNSLRIYSVAAGSDAASLNESNLVGIIQRYGDRAHNMDPLLTVKIKMNMSGHNYMDWKIGMVNWPLAYTDNGADIHMPSSSVEDRDIYVTAATWYGEESIPVLLEKEGIQGSSLEWNPGGEGMIAAVASSVYSSSIGPLLPDYVANGAGMNDRNTHRNDWEPIHWLCSFGDSTAAWIQFEFDQVYNLETMQVWNYNHVYTGGSATNRGMRTVRITYSNDGSNYSELGVFEFAQATGESDYASNTEVNFTGVPAKYVKLAVAVIDPENPQHNWGDPIFTGLSEVRFRRSAVCGDPGTVYLPGDLNEDCYVDFKDLAIFASHWLTCTDPANRDCEPY